jgi:Mor family transcriptional regulator
MTRRRILTDDQVREIRSLHQPGKRGHGYGALARKYGVGESTIRDVITYRTRALVRA